MGRSAVIDNSIVAGGLHGKLVRVPTLNATAIYLLAAGTDSVIVPVPTPPEKAVAERGLAMMPATRRSRVRLVDQKGASLSRIDHYLSPIRAEVDRRLNLAGLTVEDDRGHPGLRYLLGAPNRSSGTEPDLVGDAVTLANYYENTREVLYRMSIASKYGATIASMDLAPRRFFWRGRDNSKVHGEALYIKAEIRGLALRYSDAQIPGIRVSRDLASNSTRRGVNSLIESAEFEHLVRTQGRLGFFARPAVGLRKLRALVAAACSSRLGRKVVKAGVALGNIAPGPIRPGAVARTIERISDDWEMETAYCPPILRLDNFVAAMQVAVDSLSEFHPDARLWDPMSGRVHLAHADRTDSSWVVYEDREDGLTNAIRNVWLYPEDDSEDPSRPPSVS